MTFPNVRSEIIHRRTYARPLNEDGTLFESLEGTTDRIISHQQWLWERAQGHPLNNAQLDELEQLHDLFLTLKASPSGRTRWLGGTEVARKREASQFNPLAMNTQFITASGVRDFYDMAEGEKVTVMTHEGKWRYATAHRAGTRKMVRIGLKGAGNRQNEQFVDSSVDHTWILSDQSRVEARDLKVGDLLVKTPGGGFYDWDYDEAPTDEQLYWAYGFVYGDGAIARSGNSVTSRVRLCGKKAQYLDRFTNLGFEHSFPPSCDEDPFVYTGKYLKTLPELSDDLRMHKAFLHGYLAADGVKKVARQGVRYLGITTTNAETAQYIEEFAPACGLYIWEMSEDSRETNYGEYNGTKFNFSRDNAGMSWKVTSLEEIPDEPCWCLTVQDEAHSFMLASGIPTGNCSFVVTQSPVDFVDAFWLLLQGCGVGFKPKAGVLRGFHKPVVVSYIEADETLENRQQETTLVEQGDGHYRLVIGDSAEAWARSIGKLLTLPSQCRSLTLDFSNIRPAGIRLKGYGWISSGYGPLCEALTGICQILNDRSGTLLSCIDILDLMNLLGTTLSSRRSAEICLMDYDNPEAYQFIMAKKDYYIDKPWRGQSNNTLVFWEKPTRLALEGLFAKMAEAGGSEPGFANGTACRKRGFWWDGGNPCFEILLSNNGFCNLVELNINAFDTNEQACYAMTLLARANYRQTCVNLKDGVLSKTWHEANDFLRLCGCGITGITQADPSSSDLHNLHSAAHEGANGMADELGTPRSKAITTVKPSGTLSKVMGCSEGVHKPLGRYIFNNVNFGRHDPVIPALKAAGYRMFPNPLDKENIVVTFPVDNGPGDWDVVNGVEVNLESAVRQLDRYKMLMDNYVDHNCSVTISYDESEVGAIIEWLLQNWDSYCGVSFIYRNDPTKTARDLGYCYLPQEVVTGEDYQKYVSSLREVDLDQTDSFDEIESQECSGGVCPVK